MDFEGAFFNTSDFELLYESKLGEGTFGKVYLARNVNDGKLFAAKILISDLGFDGDQQNLLLRESLTLYKLNHPSIIKFQGVNFQSFSDPNKIEPTIITEYLPNGSLKDILTEERSNLSPKKNSNN